MAHRENYCNIKFNVLPSCRIANKLGTKHKIDYCPHYIDLVGSEYPNAQMRVYCTCECHTVTTAKK